MPICFIVFPTTSYICFKVSGLILRYLIHCELMLAQGERYGSSVSLLHMDIQFSQQHLLKRLSFVHHILGLLCKDQLALDVWVYVWVFYSNPLVFASGFVAISCCFYMTL
jgi:hypothetical protein